MVRPWGLLGLAAAAVAGTADIDTTGFLNPRISYSTGGHAICINGVVPVEISTTANVQLHLPALVDQLQATQLLLSLNSINSSTVSQLTGSANSITQVFNISSQLCYPQHRSSYQNVTTVQFLTHGLAFSKSYWDFAAPSNSYIDSAALAGRVTFSYDRLGVGESAKPDPIKIVQGPAEISIAHGLITLLRDGKLAGTSFSKVIGVGHSYGSRLTTSIAGTYPSDLDAVVVTGFSGSNITGATQFLSSLNLIPASCSPSGRFPGLTDGYLLPSTLYGLQYAFFHYPNFNPHILSQSFATIQTTTWGELLTMATVGKPATQFTGPVYVVNGEFDLDFCDGNCYYQGDISSETLTVKFPGAKTGLSGSFTLPGAGHGLNLAANAPVAFAQIQEFISRTGL
jgi:pimeloyl-ACP methyl ester carboxylesterase